MLKRFCFVARQFYHGITQRLFGIFGYVWTTDGFTRLDKLEMRNREDEMPIGRTYTQDYFRNGRLVRSDTTLSVKIGLVLDGAVGAENATKETN